jgi:uncharacterized protein (TIGR02217 family)
MAPPVFPTMLGLAFPVVKRDLWSTLKQDAISGKGTRVQLWTFPRYQWELTFSMLRGANSYTELQSLLGFINSVGGAAQCFYYSDPSDGTATNQNFGTGDGTTTTFQLARTLGGFSEPVQSPAVSSVAVNGTTTSAFSLGTAGLVTFSTAPAVSAVLTWTGTYNWLCRFDDDAAEFSEFMMNVWEVKKLSFTSVKL